MSTTSSSTKTDVSDDPTLIAEVTARLQTRLGGRYNATTIDRVVRSALDGFQNATVTSFIPVLIEHEAYDVLISLRPRASDAVGCP